MRHLANPTACLVRAQTTFAASVAEMDAELADAVASGDIDAATAAAYEAAKSAVGDALTLAATLDQSADRFHRVMWDVMESVSSTALTSMTAKRVAAIRALCA